MDILSRPYNRKSERQPGKSMGIDRRICLLVIISMSGDVTNY